MIETRIGPSPESREGLVLIQIKVSKGDNQRTETTWAKPLGDNLYELKRSLHLINGFNAGDVVRAVTSSAEELPSVLEVVKRSGYRTLHILMSETVTDSYRQNILDELKKWNATIYEMAFDRFYTVEVSPQGNYQAICDYLKSLRRARLLIFNPEVDMNTLLRIQFLGYSDI